MVYNSSNILSMTENKSHILSTPSPSHYGSHLWSPRHLKLDLPFIYLTSPTMTRSLVQNQWNGIVERNSQMQYWNDLWPQSSTQTLLKWGHNSIMLLQFIKVSACDVILEMWKLWLQWSILITIIFPFEKAGDTVLLLIESIVQSESCLHRTKYSTSTLAHLERHTAHTHIHTHTHTHTHIHTHTHAHTHTHTHTHQWWI